MTTAEVLFVLGITGLALWSGMAWVGLIAGITALLFGLPLFGDAWQYAMPLLAIGLVLFFTSIVKLIGR